ncbi:hydroxyisourate hydrolase [Actinomadura rudentiformis]|uniref:5-hydroxyisourate hydrolase n=1 Tax=Actinomadura rudentiformis TaxID=359158 RepID=A0A6H9YHT8_9ACTN|nr:hydroxyisourate hydrolase [Actinomadura rudentiformis]KAB2345499.1 hydroxyisourate hydrolase [Actinomadura rudentiformis]
MSLSTHVLDTHRGRPAAGVPVRLDRHDGDTWQSLADGVTDDDGRWTALRHPPETGTYRLRFGTGPYFMELGVATFYPEVCVIFAVPDSGTRQHVPLLVSPYGYSTYRGS